MRFFHLLLIAQVLSLPIETLACSCGNFPKTEQEVLDRVQEAGMVFLARVEEETRRSWAVGLEVESESLAKVTVIENFKGTKPGLELIIEISQTSCAIDLNVRDTYLIFAYGPMPGGLYQIDMCSAYLYETFESAHPSHYELLRERLAPILEQLRNTPQLLQ